MEMYEKFFEEFNPDKKRLNAIRKSQVFTSPEPHSAMADVNASFRATNLNFMTSNKLLEVKEVSDDRASESESMRLDELKRKESRKQAEINKILGNPLV